MPSIQQDHNPSPALDIHTATYGKLISAVLGAKWVLPLMSAGCIGVGLLWIYSPQNALYAIGCTCLAALMSYPSPHKDFLLQKELLSLRALHAHSPQGVIFFDKQGRGLWPNLSFYKIFQLPPQMPLHMDFFDTLLHTEESWQSLARLKQLSKRHQEGKETLEFHLKKTIIRMQIQVTGTFGSPTVWFIEPLSTPRRRETLPKKAILPDILDLFTYPAMILVDNKIVAYTNPAFNHWLGLSPRSTTQQQLTHYLPHPPLSWVHAKGSQLVFKDKTEQVRTAKLSDAFPLATQNMICLVLMPETPQQRPLIPNATSTELFLNSLPVPAITLDHRGYIILVNQLFQDWVLEKRLIQRPFTQWIEEGNRKVFSKFLQQLRQEKGPTQPFISTFKGNYDREIAIYARYFQSTQSSTSGSFFLILEDVTDIRKIEIQTLESQKFQALGQLAAGITHDFNNLLTAMLGFCDLLLQRHSSKDRSFNDIMQIKQNANRASNLVRQLLLFARRAPQQVTIIDLCKSLRDISLLLKRLIGPKIDLKIQNESDTAFISFDQGQLEQVIMNLAINGRDAMPTGGVLTLRTRHILLKNALPLHNNILQPKGYVVLDVSDTGDGIQEENLPRIFDPFFSTKDPGQGTGLGLATVFQILQKISGGISVQTDPREGTTFSVYIPKHAGGRQKEPLPTNSNKAYHKVSVPTAHTAKKILLVEDEDPIRLFASRALRNCGYEVFEAPDGQKALEILEKNPQIALLVTDVIMPGLDGPTLVNEARQLYKTLRVLFVSGYPEEHLQSKVEASSSTIHFLSKPFNLNELAEKVRTILS